MTAADVVSRFKGVRRDGSGWRARCPAHDDRDPSLTITEGDKHPVVLNCKAGCKSEDVAAAVGLSLQDLCADGVRANGTGKPPVVAEYDYTDEDGTRLYQAVRYLPKDFRQRRPDGSGGWTWKLGDVRRVPYRLPELVEAVQAERLVFVVEGEKDVDRLRGLGFAATCNAGGAAKWSRELSEPLRGARVVILPDNDEPGRKHAMDVAEKLYGVASEVRVVELPDLPPKGDVSDFLDAGGTKEQLKKLVRAAPLWTAETAHSTADGTPEPVVTGRRLVRTLTEILADPEATKEPEAVIPRLAFAGRLTLLSAREKEGKSTLASAGAAAVSDGARFLGEHGIAGPVLWVGLEEHTSDTARRFVAFGARPDRVHVVELLTDPLSDLAEAVQQTAPVLIVIDTLSRFAVGLVRDAGSSTEWVPVMAGLTRLARDTGAAVLLLHHAKKDGSGYRDSTTIGAGCDAIFDMTAVDEATRKMRGRGRWRIEDFAVRLDGDTYTLTAGELTLDARVLLYVEHHPGCSMRQLREGVTGKTETIATVVANLLRSGAVSDRGDPTARRLFAANREPGREPPLEDSGSREKPQGTATEPLSGTTHEGERFPVPTLRGGEREPPPPDYLL